MAVPGNSPDIRTEDPQIFGSEYPQPPTLLAVYFLPNMKKENNKQGFKNITFGVICGVIHIIFL